MAAYASLLSLENILDRLLQHHRALLDKAQIESMLENISFLQEFLEDLSLIRGDDIQALEENIKRSAYAAKDIVEKFVVDQILEDFNAGNESSYSTLFCQDLQKVMEEFDSTKKDVMKIKQTEGAKIVKQLRQVPTAGSFERGATSSKNPMVGFDEDLRQIMEALIGHRSNHRIIPIVGMGGIGKTTLATYVYHHRQIVRHFFVHAWVTISQQYSVREIILALLKDDINRFSFDNQLSDDQLGEMLYKKLYDRRYLIVLDDMWSIEVWYQIQPFFPDNENGSRVMITTRLKNVADDFCSNTPHQLHCLDEYQSWDLFCNKVFGEECCPLELEEIGMTIVRNCGGLPLAIVSISGLLAKSSRTVEYWKYIANDIYAALNTGGDGLCFEILSLSYNHLPVHLKPCFLYMSIFPKDHRIRISRLVKLWVAEGILKPKRCTSLEEIAVDNLRDLIDRNLIMIQEYGSRNKIKTCTIHDLLRYLCLREAQKEKFPCVTKLHSLNNHSAIIRQCSDNEECRQQVFDSSSLTCSESSAKVYKLLSVLNMHDRWSYEEIVRIVNSTHIDFKCRLFPYWLNSLGSLSLLWNLQTFTIASTFAEAETPIILPAEIWEMPQLKHLKREDGDFYLPDPPITNTKTGLRDIFVLKNLQTLSKIRNFRCTDGIVGSMPNLKKLGITYRWEFGWDYYEVYNLTRLWNLVSLFIDSGDNVPRNLCFPLSLKKLTLRKCGVCWEDLTAVGSLPHLEVLNLMHYAVKGPKWNPVEGEFLQLKSLRIVDTDIEEWIADESHFPCLETLKLRFLGCLKEIPSRIGEIPTLRSISLIGCSYSVSSSAKMIQEKQESFGNEDLKVQVLYNARNHRYILGTEKSERSAMAAYASRLSVGHILDQLWQHPPPQMVLLLHRAQIDTLLQNVTFLQDFLENYSPMSGDEIEALEEKIARSAYATKHMVESRLVDQILEYSEGGSESSCSTLFSQDLQKVREEFDSIKMDAMKIKETQEIEIMQQPRQVRSAGTFTRGASDSKNTVVGFDNDLDQIMSTLTGDALNLQILSVVGMGGIGKTTLAKTVFDDPLTAHHFDIHAWVTISQQYSNYEILSGLLEDVRVFVGEGEKITQENNDNIGLCLYKSLFGRRYFVVMDDMWSIEVWDGIKRFFPDDNNGSRVMVTTRLMNVADKFQSCTPHQLHFLDMDQSWALFCNKVFGKESCPAELEKAGKTIVRNCGALPLAIVTISGLLATSSRRAEFWEYIANDTHAALNTGGDGCFGIISLSYKHLPVHLKPCFLYMTTFPEDHEIRISKLIKLWVAEGILKPIRSSSLEAIAEDNFRDLVDRNLIQVHDYGSRNKIKTCTIHDLVRELCLREAQKEKFPRVPMMDSLIYPIRVIDNQHHPIIQRNSDKQDCQQNVFDTHSLACSELKFTSAKLHKLLRLLNMDDICSDEEIVRLVNSRYIELTDRWNTLDSLSLLWNLQTVIISGVKRIFLPAEIWEMPQLKHLKMEEGDFDLPDPPRTNNENGRRDIIVLKNLQTLYKIRNLRFTDEVAHRIPNLKKLGITYYNGFGLDYNLAHFLNLESLFLDSNSESVLQNLRLPCSLKKLTLKNTGVCWEDLMVVGTLRNLEVLNLMSGAVRGHEWCPVEGQFLELKSLRIKDTDLVEWIADSSHFPCLEKLQLVYLRHLKEIPYGIGGIATLRSISLLFCSYSANSSAEKIQEEQQDLQVQVR